MTIETNWKTAAASLRPAGLALIDGKSVAAAAGKIFETVNPANGSVLAEVASCDARDVDLAVRSARRAFDGGGWSRRPPAERKKVLQRLAELMRKHADELALLETLNIGKPISEGPSTYRGR